MRIFDFLLIPLSKSFARTRSFRNSKIVSSVVRLLGRGLDERDGLEHAGTLRLFVLYLLHLLQRRWANAEAALRVLVARHESSAWLHFLLSRVLRTQKKHWEEATWLESAISRRDNIARWHMRLGNVYSKMKQWREAADAYERATLRKPYREYWQYHRGYALEQLGEADEAQRAYAQAIRHDRALSSGSLGIGVFHAKMGRWPEAIRAYRAHLDSNAASAELFARLGEAYARCCSYEEAAAAFDEAMALPALDGRWHSHIGFVYSKVSRFEDASCAYERAASYDAKQRSAWLHRAGEALAMAGRHERACEVFEQAEQPKQSLFGWLHRDTARSRAALDSEICDWTDLHSLFRLALRSFEADDPAAALELLRAVAARIPDDGDPMHRELGLELARRGHFENACESFLRASTALKWSTVASEQDQAPKGELRRSALFVESVESMPIDEHLVLYESFHGRSASCNPLALFRAVVDDPRFAHLTHVWALRDVSTAPVELTRRPNVVVIRRESDAYVRYLATAKFLINNTSFSPYHFRRDGQLYLNTWHGTPLKTLGRDVRGEFAGWRNIARDLLQTTHILSPNPHTTRRLLESNQIAHLYRGEVIETGYPRIDVTLGMSEESARELQFRLGLDPHRPVILFAPTFRGTARTASVDVGRTVEALDGLRALGYQVLFRGHYFMEQELIGTRLSSLVVPESIDTNELLSVIDVLVTDYSSIAVDFLATGRPMLFYVYDLEEYAAERGLYASPAELPGVLCKTHDELIAAARDALVAERSLDPSMREAQARFCPHDDGRSSSRAVDAFFLGNSGGLPRQKDPRTSILVFAGAFIPNGISSAFLSLMNEIDATKYAVTLVIDPGRIQAFDDRRKQFDRLPSHVRVLARAGRIAATLEELRVIKAFDSNNDLSSPEMWSRYDGAFSREIRRLFGSSRFDVVINYDGYGHFWTSLLARFTGSRRVMYQHTAMLNEWRTRFPSLEGTFREYRNYDVLVSVSQSTMVLNRSDLCDMFGLSHVEHVFCDNIVSGDAIVRRSKLPPDDDAVCEFAKRPGTLFVTMGRLSPEKDQGKLLHAFAKIRVHHAESRLLIIGDGPLRGPLERTVRELGLVDSVMFAGQQSNPFPILRLADCFVFSSLYEGQGLVLLEAIMLGLPVISTDFPSAHDLLGDGRGLIVTNDDRGLFHGMMKFMNGEIVAPRFDHDSYRESALRSFYDKVIHGCGGRGLTNASEASAQ